MRAMCVDVTPQFDDSRILISVHNSAARQRQICKVCGRPDKFDFRVSDEVWAAVIPEVYRNRVVCLCCFDDFAAARGFNYADALRELWFAGDKAVFRFIPATRVTV